MCSTSRVQDSTWKLAHPLARIRPDFSEPGPVGPVDAFAGSIFDLVPGQAYHVRLTVNESGHAAQIFTTQTATRSLPAASGTANKTATQANLVSMLAGLNPGDVLELAAGTYTNLALQITRSGTPTQPIVIRGASKTGTILSDTNRVLQILGVSHVTIERMTLRGSGVNSGTNASSRGIEFWSGAPGQTNVTLRDLVFTGVDVGIKAYDRVNGALVYGCDMSGNNPWTQPEIESNATWNDDGICLPGLGNCAFGNTLRGFGDGFAVIQSVLSAGVYYYRNRIAMTGDDAFEADYGTRNLAFYDNHISNCATLLSVDPVYGGPLYCFRNIAINTFRGPFKLNSTSSGFFIYSNTIVRTEGTTGWGWVQFNNGSLRNWGYRNNVLVYRGASGEYARRRIDRLQPDRFHAQRLVPGPLGLVEQFGRVVRIDDRGHRRRRTDCDDTGVRYGDAAASGRRRHHDRSVRTAGDARHESSDRNHDPADSDAHSGQHAEERGHRDSEHHRRLQRCGAGHGRGDLRANATGLRCGRGQCFVRPVVKREKSGERNEQRRSIELQPSHAFLLSSASIPIRAIVPVMRPAASACSFDALPCSARFMTPCAMAAGRKKWNARWNGQSLPGSRPVASPKRATSAASSGMPSEARSSPARPGNTGLRGKRSAMQK